MTSSIEWIQTRGLDRVMLNSVTAGDARLDRMSAELIQRGGKRIRPTLLFLSARMGKVPDALLLPVAAAIELLHVASLYHDDIMDSAATRRGAPSANSLWGNTSAATTGTHILARAMALLAPLPPQVVSLVSEATFTLCTGQLRETEHAFDLELDEDEHLQIIGMKTATLFELPCRLGGQLSGVDPSHVQALGRYGRNLGIAFQLTDDMLDLMGDATELGKPTGTDLREGVFSHSVLVAVRQNPKGTLARLLGRASLTAEEAAQAVALVRESGALEVTGTVARGYADRAAKALASLPEGPARTSLLALTNHAVARTR
ncbi:polyprenyl synthetase family protein [Streptomyces sp. NPDC102259]|uniref:polyprenyl synthetase family protein n=1 Tax=Streptomyces sp. NPDC102259 TaxID=3366148 RepID=UPI00380A6E2E